jgi:hypothetical protein
MRLRWCIGQMLCMSCALVAVSACGSQPAARSDSQPAAKPAVAAATTPATRNACALLTKQEVEAVLERTVKDPKGNENVCHYLAADASKGASYTVYWTDGKTMMKGAGMGERLIGAMGDKGTQEALKKAAGAGGDLEGLGDQASFKLVTLHVLKGDVYLTFDARMCSRAQAIALARKAVARL